ncbi:MAG: DUF1549 domain-containing protein [Candidatus Omnitrophica bacterium]|nr:DUF1549 domain-containing protein [Candidatus Omnitrophota bacterium]
MNHRIKTPRHPIPNRIAAWVCVLAMLPISAWAGSLSVYPSELQLNQADASHRSVVVETLDSGVTIDRTLEATATLSVVGIAKLNDEKLATPIGNGTATVTYRFGDLETRQTIRIANADTVPPISFRHDVEPVLMKQGCNTGACHGSAKGKNGFKMSLFSEDARIDYVNLTRDEMGRRMNVADPKGSLLLQKPSGWVDHAGGVVMRTKDPAYETLLQWIKEGAQDDPSDVREMISLEILPKHFVLEGERKTHRAVVLAHYSDGTARDVTDLSVLSTNDDTVLKVDDSGTVTSGTRGEAYLLARFGQLAVISQAIVLPEGGQPEWPEEAVARNYVDERIFAKLKNLRLVPAEICSDEIFVRRVYLDIVGVLPTVEETTRFLSDSTPDKRAKLIDELLDRPEFPEIWAMKWADLLKVKATNELDRKAMHRYNDWLRESFSSNKPLDQMVRELLTSEGGNFTQPAVNYYVVETDPKVIAENVAQVFLGLQIKCAQCHNHPFEQWTMDDYYSFASFFSQVGRKSSSDPREAILYDKKSGEIGHIRTGQAMPPKFLGGTQPEVGGRDRRALVAEWLTSPDNPWFAKNIANRVWEQFFGAGIIDPVDDVRATNPPTHPELLEQLGHRLVETQYDLRALVREICNSYTYQQSTQPRDPENKDTRNFSCQRVRRLPAELLLDAITSVTKHDVKFNNLPKGARAVQVADGNSGNYFLSVFGRPSRDSVCACERRQEPTLGQVLHLINGDTIDTAVQDKNGRVANLVSSTTNDEKVLDELYLAAFSRRPLAEERKSIEVYLADSENRQAVFEDVLWSILNSKEFVFNH